MASPTQRVHSCGVCHRTFLPGEGVRLFREHDNRPIQRVCSLCLEGASARGWQAVEATMEQPLRMPADPGRLANTVHRDALVARLSQQLQGLERELAETRGTLDEARGRAASLTAAQAEAARAARDAGEARTGFLNADRERQRLAGELERVTSDLTLARAQSKRLADRLHGCD